MTTTMDTTATEYRDLPLDVLTESTTNPRRIFDADGLKELAASIRVHGILEPLLVRPRTERSFEIVAGARRFRAAKLAESPTVPVRIKNLTDAEALETQLIENLIRRDVHPLDEAQGFRALLDLNEPKYSIEQISAKTGKSAAYVAGRLRLTELAPAVTEAFAKDEIGVGHALLLAKLQTQQQEQALSACYQESYGNGSKSKWILLPVRHLQQWIEHNILLILKDAPFDTKNAQLVPAAGSCVDCPKRTGHDKLLFSDLGKQDACTDPGCYAFKLDAHVKQAVAAKPKLVQISTAYGQQEGSTAIPRNKYVEIHADKPERKEQRDWPQYKTCRFVTEAIVSEGSEKGELRRVCANPDCSVHHPKRQPARAGAASKAQQDKERREAAIANATGLRTLAAIAAAVPVRLMKRDLLFVTERLAAVLDENRLAVVAKQHGIKQAKDSNSIGKLFAAYLRRAEESVLGAVLVELTIVLTATRSNPAQVLRDAATIYKVDTDAIALKVKQEFAAKEKAKAAPKPAAKAQSKPVKKAAA